MSKCKGSNEFGQRVETPEPKTWTCAECGNSYADRAFGCKKITCQNLGQHIEAPESKMWTCAGCRTGYDAALWPTCGNLNCSNHGQRVEAPESRTATGGGPSSEADSTRRVPRTLPQSGVEAPIEYGRYGGTLCPHHHIGLDVNGDCTTCLRTHIAELERVVIESLRAQLEEALRAEANACQDAISMNLDLRKVMKERDEARGRIDFIEQHEPLIVSHDLDADDVTADDRWQVVWEDEFGVICEAWGPTLDDAIDAARAGEEQ